ncbi:MAG TPA: hypothetical protein VM328_13705, partial [Fimbriimonadaceae bacterium]|nr:hypothetical protein [Fimbriimonadaceae bacterium]
MSIKRNTRVLRDGRNLFEGKRVEPGVAHRFSEDELRAVVNCSLECLRIGWVDEAGRDAHLGQGVVEQVVGAAVEA